MVADSASSHGVRGPALWVGVGVILGASLAGIALSYGRQGPMAGVQRGSQTDVKRASDGNQQASAGAHEVPRTDTGSAEHAAGHRININSASQAELEVLPGVGATMAGRIIEYRKQRGGFKTVEELDRVRGIGPRLMERLRPLVTVE